MGFLNRNRDLPALIMVWVVQLGCWEGIAAREGAEGLAQGAIPWARIAPTSPGGSKHLAWSNSGWEVIGIGEKTPKI